MKIFAIAAAVALAAPLFGAPVTREQLVAMAREKVDPSVMRALVDRDCVDFDVDAANAAELSKVLPAGARQGAIPCRKAAAPARSSETIPPAPPPAVSTHPPAASAAPPPPRSEASAILPAATAGEIRVRAVFIGESAAL